MLFSNNQKILQEKSEIGRANQANEPMDSGLQNLWAISKKHGPLHYNDGVGWKKMDPGPTGLFVVTSDSVYLFRSSLQCTFS